MLCLFFVRLSVKWSLQMIPSSFKCDTVIPTLPGKQAYSFSVSGSKSHLFLSVVIRLSLPCTASQCWACYGLPGHVWAAPRSSCPTSCPSGQQAVAGRWQGCKAEEYWVDTRSAGTQYLQNKHDTKTRSGRHTSLKHKLINHLDLIHLRDYNLYFYFLGTGNSFFL